MKTTGQIDVWYRNRGFGFIHEHREGRIIKRFFHVSNIYSGTPVVGADVSFNPTESPKGLAALDVEILRFVVRDAASDLAGVKS
jgi:cold shock CspA family protein